QPHKKKTRQIQNQKKTTPAETPIIPVTLITRPIIIFLSAIADLLAPPYSITSSVGAGHESRRAPPALPTEEISHLNVAGDCCAAGFQSSPCPLLVQPVPQSPHARLGFWIVLGQVHQHARTVHPPALLRPRRARPNPCP